MGTAASPGKKGAGAGTGVDGVGNGTGAPPFGGGAVAFSVQPEVASNNDSVSGGNDCPVKPCTNSFMALTVSIDVATGVGMVSSGAAPGATERAAWSMGASAGQTAGWVGGGRKLHTSNTGNSAV